MKKKIILRQGLRVTAQELRELADELDNDFEELYKVTGYNRNEVTFQVNIINKTPKCSDTWIIEK